MRTIKLKTNSTILLSIFNFVLKEKLDTKERIKNIDKKVDAFFKKHLISCDKKEVSEILNELEMFSFYDIDNYIYESEDTFFDLISTLSKFKSLLIDKLTFNSEDRMYMDFGELEREASPNMEAYEFRGNNKITITPTHRSYGLLFE